MCGQAKPSSDEFEQLVFKQVLAEEKRVGHFTWKFGSWFTVFAILVRGRPGRVKGGTVLVLVGQGEKGGRGGGID